MLVRKKSLKERLCKLFLLKKFLLLSFDIHSHHAKLVKIFDEVALVDDRIWEIDIFELFFTILSFQFLDLSFKLNHLAIGLLKHLF